MTTPAFQRAFRRAPWNICAGRYALSGDGNCNLAGCQQSSGHDGQRSPVHKGREKLRQQMKSVGLRFVGSRWVLAWVFAAIAVTLACGSTEPEDTDVVTTRALEIVDAQGVPRIIMSTFSNGSPTLVFLDEDGDQRAWIFLADDGSPNLILSDKPKIALEDGAGNVLSILSVDQFGRASILLRGNPVLALQDRASQVRLTARLGGDGVPSIEAFDPAGEPVIDLLGTP